MLSGSIAQMIVLVDYDNLGIYKLNKLGDLVSIILDRIAGAISETRVSCCIRLYGGWYDEKGQSVEGKKVSMALMGNENSVQRFVGKDGQVVFIKSHIEMASSILQKPDYDLFYTYRMKSKAYNIRVKRREDVNCRHEECLLPVLSKFLKSGKCPRDGCPIDDPMLVWRNEQKLVDSMIVCDMVYSANIKMAYIVLVSDDDDFIPALLALGAMHQSVFRISPKGESLASGRFRYTLPNVVEGRL